MTEIDRSHGSPYDRGRADAYYRRSYLPHKYVHRDPIKGDLDSVRVEDLSPEEKREYSKGFDDAIDQGDFKEWD